MASVSSGPPPVSFHIAFERLKNLMSKDDARAIASTSMEDVWTAAKDIERQLELRRSLRGFRRIQPFLAGIEQYSKVVEVVCNGTPYLPYIWAPVKLLLQIAQTHISALERLIDAYAMIGEAMPRFDKLSSAFKDDPEFLHVMSHFYEDVLEFHRRAYKYFRRRAWTMVFDSLWKTFDSRFQAILQSLRKHRDLIDQAATTINLVEAKLWRGQQLEQIRQWRAERARDLDKAEHERLSAQIREAMVWFGAAQEQDDVLTRLTKGCDTANGHWMLREPMILAWLERSRDNQFLWLHGKPGAGKSFICAKIIEHVQDFTDGIVIFYFCNHHQTSQSPADDILRSFATQLLAANTELAPYILETFANQALRPTKKYLGIILEKLITSLPSVRIVVDGLDECATSEQEDIIGDLLRIKGSMAGACKTLLSCRKLPFISRLLQDKPTFRLDDHAESVNDTISSFVYQRLGSLRQEFDNDLIDELGNQIIAKANGMFLWVRLVLFTLEDLHFESDIRQATQALPEGLEAVYERILSRICGNLKSPNQRTATRILQWMLVARRPLKRYEIESGIVLDDRVSRITPAARPRGDVLSSCYPILDVEDGPCGYVSFCHFTALEYLRTPHSYSSLQYPPAQLTVSLACVLYLISSFDLVDPRIPNEETRSQVAQCFHDLQLYANDHWLDHLSALADLRVDSPPGGSSMLSLSQGLERLTERHNGVVTTEPWNTQVDDNSLPSAIEGSWPQLGVATVTQSLLNRSLAYKAKIAGSSQIASSSSEPGAQGDPTLFSRIRAQYQSILEELLERSHIDEVISGKFASRHRFESYLCHYRNCPRAIKGFSSSDLRQEHENSHAPSFLCTNAACAFSGKILKSRAAVNNHNKKYHSDDGVAAIPTSLRKAPAPLQQDRSRFLLKETSSNSRKRSYHAAEDDTVMSEVSFPINLVPDPQTARPLMNENQGQYLIKCICGFEIENDDTTIVCNKCDTWQHSECYYVDEHGQTPRIRVLEGLEHCCVDCKPRPLDAKGATNRQMKRMEKRVEYNKAVAMADKEAKKEKSRDSFQESTTAGSDTPSDWSVVEEQILRALFRKHGTDWTTIAKMMQTKTDSMVRHYYQRAIANGDIQMQEDLQRLRYQSLNDYDMQLILLERQNNKRLMMAREDGVLPPMRVRNSTFEKDAKQSERIYPTIISGFQLGRGRLELGRGRLKDILRGS